MPIRFNKKTHTWFFRFSRGKHSYFKGGFRTKKQAEESEVSQLNNVIKKELHPELAGHDRKFADAGQWFFDNHSITRKRSWKNDRGRIKVMTSFFGQKKLSDITVSDIASLREHLKSLGLGAHTVNHYQATLKSIFNRLKKFGLYHGDNPATKVEMEKVPRARVRFLYPNEERTLTPAVKDNVRLWPYYFVGLHTGMRISELCNIRVKDVSIAGTTIFVPNSKSSRSRHVPISNDLSEFLEPLNASKDPEAFILAGMCSQWVQRAFKQVCKGVGISNLTFHNLRHTAAQRLLTKGVPIYMVAKILGHSSVIVTEQHYGHLALSDLKSAVDQIDGIVSSLHSSFDETASAGCTQVAFKIQTEPNEIAESR